MGKQESLCEESKKNDNIPEQEFVHEDLALFMQLVMIKV